MTEDENDRGHGDSDSEENQTLNRYSAPEGNQFAVGNKGGNGAPEGNGRAITHGVTASPTNLLDELDSEEREFVEQLSGSLLQIAPFDADDSALYERLQLTVVKAVQERRGEREILKNGPTVEKVVSISESGEVHTEKDEHYLAKFTSRLSKDIRLNLKDLGCLPDPDSEQAAATRSLAQVLSGDDE